MHYKNIILSAVFMLLCMQTMTADNNYAAIIPLQKQTVSTDGKWWGYFDGNYDSTNRQGVGLYVDFPITYNIAIKIEADNPDVAGKIIKAVRFAIPSTDSVENVKIWMSTHIPVTIEKSDVCCQNVKLSALDGFDTHGVINEITLDEPYLFGSSDMYVGYTFTLTSKEADLNAYPLILSKGNTSENGLFFNWGEGWKDYSGSEFGNLALMLLLDDDVSFVTGDVNYDSVVNVGDISATVQYILGRKVKSFNRNMADVDGNGEINIVDVASITDIIMGCYAPDDNEYNYTDEKLYTSVNNGTMDMSLVTGCVYKAFQMDVVLPKGENVTDVDVCESLKATHIVTYSKISDGKYRVLFYSPTGSLIGNLGESIVRIKATTDKINTENIIFATSGLKEKHLRTTSDTNTAGIDDVTKGNKNNAVYTINGVKLNSSAAITTKGLYIVNDKKVMVR